jgi:hypothetical protein
MRRVRDNQRVLRRAFRDVRENVFPRWDLKSQWTVKKVKHLPISAPVIAYTNHSLKTIFVNYLPNDKNSLYSLLIHEICHAITSGQHHKRWEKRMMKSADKASKIGNFQLVKLIYEDLDNVKRAYLKK